MFGRCKVCLEKDARILELKSQIEDLKRLVFNATSSYEIPTVEVEADSVLSGKQTLAQSVVEDERAELLRALQEEASERDRILSGNY